MTLPTDYDARKQLPIVTGVLDYFTDAIAEIAKVSAAGNAQHNPEAHAAGVLFWNRGKSQDEANTCMRHLAERGGFDTDGVRHSAKAAWRAMALLQKELEAAHGYPPPRGCIPPEERGAATTPTPAPAAPESAGRVSYGWGERVRLVGPDIHNNEPDAEFGIVVKETDREGDTRVVFDGDEGGGSEWFPLSSLQPDPTPGG
jgi:hypothetical protein